MKEEQLNKLTCKAIQASIEAGKATLQVFNEENIEIQSKEDNSPLTRADLLSNQEIKKMISEFGIPLLSEEDKQVPYNIRSDWKIFWLIDPLDGTKEFINRSGEFTVNIALIENNIPIAGVIYVPVLNELYFANKHIGSYKLNDASLNIDNKSLSSIIKTSLKLPLNIKNKMFNVVASKSHLSKETTDYIDKLKEKINNIDFVSKGSSLKLCLIAEGTADLYPRFGPTMEWDVAAGHAIVKYSGGKVFIVNTGTELSYNKENLLNPFFIAEKVMAN